MLSRICLSGLRIRRDGVGFGCGFLPHGNPRRFCLPRSAGGSLFCRDLIVIKLSVLSVDTRMTGG